MDSRWVDWARRLDAIAQNGLTFTENEFDTLRYQDVREVAAEILAEAAACPIDAILPRLEADAGYRTPKLDARGVVFREDRILLVRERSDGLWTLPGGWVDVGDALSEAVEREVREESGFLVKARKLLACFDRRRHPHPPSMYHSFKLFVLCDLQGGEATASNETDGAEFFAEQELPPLSVPRVVAPQIARMFEHLRHPHWPTDFD